MKRMKGWAGGVLLAMLAQGGIAVAQSQMDEYDIMRAKWQARGGAVDTSDPDVQAQIAAANAAAQTQWDAMQKQPGRTALWADYANWNASATVTNNFSRLGTLANAYVKGSDAMRGNAALLADVLSALDWLVSNHYAAGQRGYDNWWDWQIGAPQALNNVLVTLYPWLSAQQKAACFAAIDWFMPDPTLRTNFDGTLSATVETGANLLDKAFVAALRGMLAKESSKLAQGRDAIAPALPYVTTGDGFYTDGTFIQHVHEPYVGGYGGVLLTDIARLYALLDGTSWEFNDPNKGLPYDWAMKAFRPFMYDGAMMDMQRGRGLTRQASTDHIVGRGIVSTMLNLAQSLPDGQARDVKSMVKGWIQRDTTFGPSYVSALPGLVGSMSATDITQIKALLNDSTIAAMPEAVETHVFAAGDRVLQRRPGHAFGISMFSKRMSAFESGNGENLRGWWTGIGTTWLYNADQNQYGGDYWATVDMWRLPGITTDHTGSGTPVAWKHYGNTRAGVGGADLEGLYAAAGMDFATTNVTASTLSGKKAWFLFGDYIVAAGSGITATNGESVETIVENRKLSGAGDNALTVNGNAVPATLGWSQSLPATRWAHLAGSVPGADIGYVFPDQPAVNGLRQARTGAWRDVYTLGSTDSKTANYLSLALDHGVNPSSAAYTYAVLPNKSASDVAAFSANPPFTVLERSTAATAVKDGPLGVTGLVFWNDGSKTVNAGGQPFVTSDRKAVVVVRQTGSDLAIAIADPTQAYQGNLNIELNRSAVTVISKDPAITVVQTTPTIKLAVNVAASGGKSYAARFTLNGTASLAPSDDAFLRDGTYGTSNFGKTTYLTVKGDAASYNRKSLLKFDLSSVEGTITSATLKLVATSVGQSTPMTHKLYLTAGSGWNENTVTWNNAPADGALVTSWQVPAVNAAVQADVTSQAQAAMAGAKVLSLAVEAAANYGSAGSVDYGSKDHTNPAMRPALVVTYRNDAPAASEPPPAQPGITGNVQAESATLGGGALVKNDKAGFQGTGFVTFPASGGSAQFDGIDGGAGGVKAVTVRYANGNPTPRSGVLNVNGVAQPVTFKITGGWANWTTLTANVNLAPGGANTLRFESTGQSLGNIDDITIP
ncbi:DNRLRE domain-containing protein [Duganella sp. FT92W]|uniref:DNRLRE domain-containing protein n=1 Tax=Pseudoduganella rivuli TaxID=2666085 RepID=A0A7X2IIH0_9BURK|nr:polysaccharide lyase family 8 super-sandwich domain-containing protein [Pseudoduganella rivuli]MRV70273.1 DNRLRE domain-containing protein [Pseudoduganella rivuli]